MRKARMRKTKGKRVKMYKRMATKGELKEKGKGSNKENQEN